MLVPFATDIAPHGSQKPSPFSEFTSNMLGVPAIRGVIVIAAYLINFAQNYSQISYSNAREPAHSHNLVQSDSVFPGRRMIATGRPVAVS